MKTIKFYGYFAQSFGSLWIFFFLIAFITQSHINLGTMGFFGFPVLSAVYAYLRMKDNTRLEGIITQFGRRIDLLVAKCKKNGA